MIVIFIGTHGGNGHHCVSGSRRQFDKAIALFPLQLVSRLGRFDRFVSAAGVEQQIIPSIHESLNNRRLTGYAAHCMRNGCVIGVSKERFIAQPLNVTSVVVIQIQVKQRRVDRHESVVADE